MCICEYCIQTFIQQFTKNVNFFDTTICVAAACLKSYVCKYFLKYSKIPCHVWSCGITRPLSTGSLLLRNVWEYHLNMADTPGDGILVGGWIRPDLVSAGGTSSVRHISSSFVSPQGKVEQLKILPMIHGSQSFYSKSTQIDSIQIARLYSFNKWPIEPINRVNIDDLLLELWWISNQWCIQSQFGRGIHTRNHLMCLCLLALGDYIETCLQWRTGLGVGPHVLLTESGG